MASCCIHQGALHIQGTLAACNVVVMKHMCHTIIAVFCRMTMAEVMVARQGVGLALVNVAVGSVMTHLIQANAIAATSMCSFVVNCERSAAHVKGFRARIQII